MTKKASRVRVQEQMNLSEAVYSAIDQTRATGEAEHRMILRDCLGTLAVSLEQSRGYRYASDVAHRHMLDHFANAGLTTSNPAYDPYTEYRAYAAEIRGVLPRPFVAPSAMLATVFAAYGDVQRATRDAYDQQETDSRHVVHTTALAIPYALHEYPDLDPSLVSSYLLIHDIVEWHAGDTASLDMSPEEEASKKEREAEALELFAETFSTTYPKTVALVQCYEALADDEAKFAKTFEKLDPGFTHFRNAGRVIKELGITTPEKFWQKHHETYVRMSRYALGFPKVLEDRDMRAQDIEQVTWPTTS